MKKFNSTVDYEDIVQYDAKIEKDLKKLPDYIIEKFKLWVNSINRFGIQKTRESKGFHDEPLKGQRIGQRSVRLSKAYRAIYIEDKQNIKIIIIEVNKHAY